MTVKSSVPPPRAATIDIPMSPATLRRLCKLSLVRVAGLADVGVNSARIYEIDPWALSEGPRRKLSTFYARLREEIAAA